MKKKDKYTVYNSQLDQFVRIAKLDDNDMDTLFEGIKQRVLKPNYHITDYIRYIACACVHDTLPLIKENKGADIMESLFDNVLDVYPCFSVDNAMRVLNIGTEEVKSKEPTKYNLSQIEALAKKLKRKLIGQDSAVDAVIKAVKLVNSGLEKSLSLFFIGPTGVGKTELARLLSEDYLGSRKKLLKINCGEYSGAHEYSKLIGSPPGYIGHNEKGILTEKADESSEWVILFDEIEKAHPKFYSLLLNLLDEGSITDSRGTVLDFSNSIILFTSNVGIHENVGKSQLGFGASTSEYANVREDIEKAYKDKFSPEFRNRLDGLVHFNQLTKEDAGKIAKIQLAKLPLYQSAKLTKYVIDNSFSKEYGARNIKRFIKNNISVKIADKILSGNRDVKFKALFDKDAFLDVSS